MLRYDEAMQVTIDIPEPLYHELESRSQGQSTSLEEFVLEAAESAMARARHVDAINQAKKPAILEMNLNLNDFMLMTDDEMELFGKIAAIDPEAAVKVLGIRRLGDAF